MLAIDLSNWFEFTNEKLGVLLSRDQHKDIYNEVFVFASLRVIDNHMLSSWNKIGSILESAFNGPQHNPSQPEIATAARMTHLFHRLNMYQQQKDYTSIIEWTNHYNYQGRQVISREYKIPPHLAWQSIVQYRFAAFIESAERLKQFRDMYEEFTELMYRSTDDNKAWYHAFWPDVQNSMESMLKYACQQLLVAADQTQSVEEKLTYLFYLTKGFKHARESHYLNDELRFWAAYQYLILNKYDECKHFYDSIRDLHGLLKMKQGFTDGALCITEQIDQRGHRSLFAKILQWKLPVKDELLTHYALKLLKGSFIEEFFDSNRALGTYTKSAYCLFETSKGTQIIESIKLLVQEDEKLKQYNYWLVLYMILSRCLSSIKYSPNKEFEFEFEKAETMLWGLGKWCADQIQTFPFISSDLKDETQACIEIALSKTKKFILSQSESLSIPEINKRVSELFDQAERSIKIKNGEGIFEYIETIFRAISYDYIDNDGSVNKYVPVEVPADHDCAFHAIGISRNEGMCLLIKHVQNQTWSANMIDPVQNSKDVFTIILDDLEIRDQKKYDRCESMFTDNHARVMAYLKSLSQQGVWMPYNQKGRSVLDALALLLKKNLRIFVAEANGKLCLTSNNIHDESFETIDMLCTSTKGFCSEQSECMHYIRLLPLSSQVIELVERKTNQTSGMRLFENPTRVSSPSSSTQNASQEEPDRSSSSRNSNWIFSFFNSSSDGNEVTNNHYQYNW